MKITPKTLTLSLAALTLSLAAMTQAYACEKPRNAGRYDSVDCLNEGLAAVELNGKEGFVDRTGKVVVPIKYDWAGWFSEGLAQVRLNGKRGYIDRTGKVVVPIKYDYAWYFKEGLAWVEKNGKGGFVNRQGKEVIPLRYVPANDHHNYDIEPPEFSGGIVCSLKDSKNSDTDFCLNKQGRKVKNPYYSY